VVLDLWRDRPLINLRWLASRTMRWFLPSVLAFRIVLSEQPTGAIGMMAVLGVTNEQMHALFGWVTFGIVAGFAIVIVGLALRSLRPVLLASLALVVVASLMDAGSTSLTRPHDIAVSQTLIAVATAMFLGASFVLGLLPVVQDGQRNIVSFLALLIGAQIHGLADRLGVARHLRERRSSRSTSHAWCSRSPSPIRRWRCVRRRAPPRTPGSSSTRARAVRSARRRSRNRWRARPGCSPTTTCSAASPWSPR
jgi:hypothetical protein